MVASKETLEGVKDVWGEQSLHGGADTEHRKKVWASERLDASSRRQSLRDFDLDCDLDHIPRKL